MCVCVYCVLIAWLENIEEKVNGNVRGKAHNETLLWDIVNTEPIKNEETIYATFMSAAMDKYETRIFE